MKRKIVIWGGVLFAIAYLGIYFTSVFGGNDHIVPNLPVLFPSHEVKQFRLKDQRGRTITADSVKGKVFVVNFFFTSCQDVCVSMNRNVDKIYNALHEKKDFMILSHTVNPSTDSVAVLAKYAKQWNADPNQWLFLTGSKKELYHLARQTYMISDENGTKPKYDTDVSDFVHTQLLALIGRRGRIRGIFNSLNPADIQHCIKDAKILLAKNP